MKKRLLWLVAIPLIVIGSLTYAENDLIVPDTAGWTITVYSQDKSYWITIQDKNLWATNVGDYWDFYQWWNNHGNSWNSETVIQLLDRNDSYENHWYDWEVKKFIKIYDISKYDYWTETSWGNASTVYANWKWNNLWWGWNDNDDSNITIVKWYDTVNHVATNVTWRQWPCPEWYHVPSAWEWQELMMLWCNANSDICSWSVITTQNGEYARTNYLSSNGIWTAFSNDLQLPLAGYRSCYDGAFYGQGNYAFYWSSSPRGGSNPKYAWYLNSYSYYVNPSDSNVRAHGQSLRCFKNSYVKLPKTLNLFFMSEGEEVWTWEVTENMTGAVPEKAKNVTKTWYVLEYRYLSGADASTGFDFDNEVITWWMADESGNVYFIAEWTGITYTVEFTWTDVEWTMNPQTFTYGVTWTLTPNAFTKTWYTFSGWTDWTTWYTDGQEVINLTTTSGEVIILTAQWTKIETKPSWGSSGWGGRSSKTSNTQDSSTSSQNDKKTENVIQSETKWSEESSKAPMDSSTSSQNDGKSYTQEFQQAYEFAKWKWITTMPTINEANMDWKLTRIAMAKMLSQYAMNVLWQKPANIVTPKFNDVTDKQNSDYDDWVSLAYQLWIMWQNMPNNKFRPDDEVTRAEFATALSRMLYHTSDWEYKSTDKYYTNHMKKLVQEKIITNDDAKMKELRWYVMIMLMRSAK